MDGGVSVRRKEKEAGGVVCGGGIMHVRGGWFWRVWDREGTRGRQRERGMGPEGRGPRPMQGHEYPCMHASPSLSLFYVSLSLSLTHLFFLSFCGRIHSAFSSPRLRVYVLSLLLSLSLTHLRIYMCTVTEIGLTLPLSLSLTHSLTYLRIIMLITIIIIIL